VLDADLGGSTMGKMVEVEPGLEDRHIEMGIAEANMISTAGGLSRVGKIPFCSTFAVFAAGASLVPSFRKNALTVRDIAEDGVLIAMAFGLNFLKLFAAPTGGSVNLQMLPLMLIALRHGPFHGFLCGGLIYGLLTCLTDGYGFATYPFDYLIGFGSVAVLGFFRPLIFGPNQKGYNLKGEIFLFIGGVASTALRYVGGTVSSMVVYQADLVYALWYNSIYITVSGAFAFAVIMALYGPLVPVNALFPVNRGLAKSDLK
jgi:thiamine transporter ThiT